MTAGGFLLASNGSVDQRLLAATLIGIAGVVASACVANNIIDRRMDAKMDRTKKRALVSGKISPAQATVFAVVLGAVGFGSLFLFTNSIALFIAALGWYFYVVVYGIWKRQSVHGTLVGTISGSIPPVVGYTAVTGFVDVTAMLIFLAMVFWQMTHFYSIAIFRLKDYKAAGIPVLPAVKGIDFTKNQILLYGSAFVATVLALSVFGNTGYAFAIVLMAFGFVWLYRGLLGISSKDDIAWARGMFGYSLIVLMAFSILLSINTYLP
jgi:heme o synthase